MHVPVTAGTALPHDVEATLVQQGLRPYRWSAGPGEIFDEHTHAQHKVLFCVDGKIIFRVGGTDWPMRPGDRLDLPANTRHEAVAGPAGVTCVEAFLPVTGPQPGDVSV
ncbi:cupin domain-containing protein [Protofrankia sp. BMG5.30]|uniref:cupin domain-containing protein n=1 Tax=Protofrankia sp. BMG5.30 TaxID=1834514 RepID=UPI0009776D01|nr:cupin domain-containing protein [Protofrankia sp. BMG5.30]ONH34439.1 cupin [Protofrankia sp. BMG5.30]